MFLDYFATGKLDVTSAAEVIAGIAEGCRQAGCALVGGETAEMPGMYSKGDYDLAGFSVGAVERGRVLPRADIKPGDVVLGLASSGVHSNGFSLVRKVASDNGLTFESPAPFDATKKLGEALLAPTKIYVRSLLEVVRKGQVKGMAHITGGGLLENIPRVLPDGIGVSIDANSWKAPAVFGWLAKAGNIEPMEMARTFNCGIGMIVVVEPALADEVAKTLAQLGETVSRIGVVEANTTAHRVTLKGASGVWPC